METTELLNNMRAEALKALAKSAGLPRTITRKPELVTELNRFVMNRLPDCLQSLSAAERHLLAEAAHNHGRVKPKVFAAKYGVRCPSAGYFDHKKDTSLIHLLIGRDRYSGEVQIPDAIAAPRRNLFTVLANHDLAVGGQEPLTAADQSMLERCAAQHGDRVWRLELARILDYLEQGGSLDDIRRFLAENAANEVPASVNVFLDDLDTRTRAVVGSQPALLIELADGPTAATIAHDSQAGKYCYLAGDRFVAVPEKNERAFRTALKKLGFVL